MRINSSIDVDDAAGNVIYEKKRNLVRGFGMTGINSKNAILIVQTTEGGKQTSRTSS